MPTNPPALRPTAWRYAGERTRCGHCQTVVWAASPSDLADELRNCRDGSLRAHRSPVDLSALKNDWRTETTHEPHGWRDLRTVIG